MRELETYIKKIENMDWYTKRVCVKEGKITKIIFRCDDGVAILASTEKEYIFASDFLKSFTIKKAWWEGDIAFNEINPVYFKSYVNSANGYKLTERVDDHETYMKNVYACLKNEEVVDDTVWDVVNDEKSTDDDINAVLEEYLGYDDEAIEELYEDYTEDYLMFMAILKIAKDYALAEGEVDEYPVYDATEHRAEVRRRDMEFVFQLLKDREHGKEVGNKAVVTKISERLIKVEYDGKKALLRWVGNHPFLEALRTNEEWRIWR